jgi:alkylation response protein AidB-like acyl-CoA dehydrogenase
MDLRYTPEQEAFRSEVRSFFANAVPKEMRRKLLDGRRPDRGEVVQWQRTLNAKGWAVPGWPKAWGGCDWSPIQHTIFQEEQAAAPAPPALPFNVNMIGPVLIAFGTEQQKGRFLPRIANLDDWWCQGFSEPGSGSDLASLSTYARKEGDNYVVNGQKIWTTYAQYADWIFCLVRTDRDVKKQSGISFLLIDMKSHGVTVRKIETIDGIHSLNEIFFDDVRVPMDQLVGRENCGWDCAKFLLGNERVCIADVGHTKARLRQIRALALKTADGGKPMIEQPIFAQKLAMAEIEAKALEITQFRLLEGGGGAEMAHFPSIVKLKGTELQQTVQQLFVDLAGPSALAAAAEGADGRNSHGPSLDEPDWALTALENYFYGRAATILGGSDEIQKNILSKTMGLS